MQYFLPPVAIDQAGTFQIDESWF
ncbi:hypothetical protein EYZ11_000955 [Aspergillus tanneri]|uniref:Uncharacterized protein n=1 Tax=Aspergillus tanneri TaxID=1220188 RepID=A0A4S3JVW4_9EURO|nr:hypothetical protein EYZ11_000955 [Aspergillus tanneri]